MNGRAGRGAFLCVCLVAGSLCFLASFSWCTGWSQFQSEDRKCGVAVQEKVTQLAPRYELGLWSDVNGETVFTASSAIVGGATIYIGTGSGDFVAVEGKCHGGRSLNA